MALEARRESESDEEAAMYPYDEGDVTVIGPECFAMRDGTVLCWRGENYTPQRMTLRVRLHNLVVGLLNRLHTRRHP